MAGAIVGLIVGLMLFGFIAGVIAFALVKRAEDQSQSRWHLVPVVVAARDLAPGSKLTAGDLSQRPMPEQMLTGSVVAPESARYALLEPLTVPVRAGDPLQWSFFFNGVPLQEGVVGVEIAKGCAEAARRSRRFAPSNEASDAEIRSRLAGSR